MTYASLTALGLVQSAPGADKGQVWCGSVVLGASMFRLIQVKVSMSGSFTFKFTFAFGDGALRWELKRANPHATTAIKGTLKGGTNLHPNLLL